MQAVKIVTTPFVIINLKGNKMKRAAGFTLIELVIVIVILGILGAVAAPRFINLQGDAYEANVKALKGSIQSAMTLANAKAIIDGADGETGTVTIDGKDVTFAYGFPTGDTAGILSMLQDDLDSYTVTGDDDATTAIVIKPEARNGNDVECQVTYTPATSAAAAKVEAKADDC
ncbi:pilus assembly FimT family protein [Oceanimonas smirnovii]|uniref:pilus assembly FimT family protein n=1 Tax=Oceanimonas smirnovii TaxID=264574 RepID=UPI003FD6BCF3